MLTSYEYLTTVDKINIVKRNDRLVPSFPGRVLRFQEINKLPVVVCDVSTLLFESSLRPGTAVVPKPLSLITLYG
jgi:hypothetical protein